MAISQEQPHRIPFLLQGFVLSSSSVRICCGGKEVEEKDKSLHFCFYPMTGRKHFNPFNDLYKRLPMTDLGLSGGKK